MVIHSFYPLLSLFSFVSFPGIRLCYSFSWVWCRQRSVWIFIELARRNCTDASTIIHNVWIVTQRHPNRLWGWIYMWFVVDSLLKSVTQISPIKSNWSHYRKESPHKNCTQAFKTFYTNSSSFLKTLPNLNSVESIIALFIVLMHIISRNELYIGYLWLTPLMIGNISV